MKINSFKCYFLKLSKNKGIELQISRWKDSKFNFEFVYRDKTQDHKGFDVVITLWYEFRLAFYDFRHRNLY